MIKKSEQYRVFAAADHGMDGYIIDTSKEKYHFQNADEIRLIKELFMGDVTIEVIYDRYVASATQMYGSFYGHVVDLIKDKLLFKFLMELSSNLQGGFNARIKNDRTVNRYPWSDTIDTYLEAVDAANNDFEYRQRTQALFEEANYSGHLSLFYSGLGNKAAKALGEMLITGPTSPNNKRPHFFQCPVRGINLTRNFLGDSGCEALSLGLSHSKRIQYLGLRENAIGDKGFFWLAKALHSHPTLIQLDLIACQLTDSCINHLNELILNNNVLQIIRLSGNNITDKGVEMILESVKSHPSIQEINLYNTKVSTQMREQLDEVLNTKSTLSCSK